MTAPQPNSRSGNTRPSTMPGLVSGAFLQAGLLACSLLALGGCAEMAATDAEERGEAPGNFEYRCVGEHDAFAPCGVDNAFPETVAVGAEFEIHFQDPEGSSHQVVSAAPDRLELTGPQRFHVLESGYLAVVAMGTNAPRDRRALDFIHLNAKPVERLGLREMDGDEDLSTLRLMHGQVRTVIARPYAAGTKQIAAGALPYEWETSNSNIVQLEQMPNSRTVGLVARQPGAAVLTVYQGDVERSIDVTVVAQQAPSNTGTGADDTETEED